MIVQSILIRWTKETRGEPYASLRSRHPTCFPLSTNIIPIPPRENSVINEPGKPFLWHQLSFEQTKQGIEWLQEQYKWLPVSGNHIEMKGELPGMRWRRIENKLLVHARYDRSFGKPVRTNGQSELLDEQAFELLPLQYGQIIINGRHTMEDGSVYEQRIMNIWNVTDDSADYSGMNRNTLKQIPDFQYKQLAALW
ncbi:hypothetical protein [Paenibacillus wenxiniae]|uniref:Uncharacterized protein n=1 Tax=Paenibacillus wenxiniae TaxID=1636843 RepID=A0ABW4RN62_9BACL